MPRNKYHDTPVVEFHEAFGAPIAWQPTVPPLERRSLRAALLWEEFCEFVDASGLSYDIDGKKWEDIGLGRLRFVERPGIPVELSVVADALADIQYINDGTSLEFGIPLAKCFREVHRSNMSKLGDDGKPILRDDGKILKGPGYTLPQIDMIIELYSGIHNG